MLNRGGADRLLHGTSYAIVAGMLFFVWTERTLVAGIGFALSLVGMAASNRLSRDSRSGAKPDRPVPPRPVAHPLSIGCGLFTAAIAALAMCWRVDSRGGMLSMLFLALFFGLLAARLLASALPARRG